MAARFRRWDNALRKCMDAKKNKDAKGNRWQSDPLQLNQEAHELPPQKQREALEAVDEAPRQIREQLAPMWKYCFVQWHVYDASLEAIEQKKSLSDTLSEAAFAEDVQALAKVFESGALGKAKTAEEWTWSLLDPIPPAGSIDPWTESTGRPVLQAGRAERKQGVTAFAEEKYDQAMLHFSEGLRLVAGAPGTTTGPHAKLRCDLYKNKASAALQLGLSRLALQAASQALAIDREDPKAWYRKARALEALGRHDDARSAMANTGLELSPVPQQELSVSTASGRLALANTEEDLNPTPAVEELESRFHKKFEQLVFVEVGIGSLAAVDMVMYLRSELRDVPIPLTLVFDCPVVKDAVKCLLEKIQAQDDAETRAKMNSTVWRAMCRALGTDPVKGVIEGRLGHVTWPEYSESEASAAMDDLKAIYEDAEFSKKVRTLAKQVAFDQRAFLVRLRPLALEVQKPILEKRGFDPDFEGLRQLECAIVNAVMTAPKLGEQLLAVRVAQQGGTNGMWAVNMEQEEGGEPVWADSHKVQCWSQFMQADPFGPNRKKTHTAASVA